MRKPKSDYSIQTVVNALRVLEILEEAPDQELGVTALSMSLNLHKNNVFRLLATLEERGYVEQSPTDRYRLGVRCVQLGRSSHRAAHLLRRARSVLAALASQTGECVHLAVMRDFEVAHLDGELPSRLLSSQLRIGTRLPVHCTALGKVLLGCADESVRAKFDRQCFARDGLERRTPLTVVDREKLFDHLTSVATQGFALDVEECETGVVCAAAPVFDARGQVIAALSASAPALRVDPDDLVARLVPQVIAAGEGLSHQLGYVS
jgi:DNA-binding IclR family transcriptional regulator